MKILFVINSFSIGGAEKLVYNLALQLIRKTKGISIVGLYKINSSIEKQMCEELEREGIKIYIIGKRPKKDRLKSIYQIYKIIKKDRISVIHAHCVVPMFLTKISGFLLNLPVICTVHSTSGYSVWQEKFTSWMCKKYISVGDAVEQYLVEKLHISNNKIVKIYNGIDTKYFISAKKKDLFWQDFGGSIGDINLVSIGRVHEAKNQLCMFNAMMELKKQGLNQYKLYIIGPYDENDNIYEKLCAFIKSQNLQENIHFLGSKKNIADFLINADCFLMTSLYEGLSLAFLEAVISGIPIISTDLDFVCNLNRIAPCALLIPQNDSKYLAKLLATKKFLNLNSPKELFSKLFSIEECAKKHFDLYKQIAND